ncbi:hypothetical protein ACH5RR_029196 [Cinchona calisaya]|uniref:Integrase zinc-binding domain-containing protein n=1 Tax=Cinchona calisaya TaxID=153742 RepID=A0ABD2YQY6_9GENT
MERENLVADALSGRIEEIQEEENEAPVHDVNSSTVLRPSWLTEVSTAYKGDPKAKELPLELSIKGHSRMLGTYQRLKSYFYWPGLKKDVI